MSIIKFYDLVGELGIVSLDSSNNPTNVSFTQSGLELSGYKPFLNNVTNNDRLYVKLQQTAQSAFAVVIARYVINEFGVRSLEVERTISKYGTLNSGVYAEASVFNDISINHSVSANQLLLKPNTALFTPELQTSDYIISLSGNGTVRLPLANILTENVKYGFLLSSKYNGLDSLTIAASGTDSIVLNSNNTVSSISVTGVGTYVELVGTSGGQWYKLFSTELFGGEGTASFVGGLNKAVQFNNAGSISGGKVYWDDPSKTLYFGDTNNVLNADLVVSASQNKASGIYPFYIRLNNGNFFALTKDGKVSINTQSLPLYESSPNFHMVGRCAVFEGNCGAAGVALTLFNNPDVVPQVGSVGGSFNMSARNSNRNVVNYAQVQSKILNPNKGVSSGQFLVNVDVSGSPYNVTSLDLANLVIGNNDIKKSIDSAVIGKNNELISMSGGKVLGNNNTIDSVSNVYVIGSDNSVDFIKNSVRYTLSEPNISTLSGLEWNDLDDLQAGDIVQVTNNSTINGYYIAQTTNWIKVEDNVAVGYFGNANFIIGSDSTISGNNLIAIGSNSNASGNNLSVFGNFNNIRTQSISDIINTNFRPDYSTVIGNVNTFDASGVVVFGNRNAGSGIRALMLNGSLNTIGSGTLDSVIIGNNNELTSISGVVIGNRNFGIQTLSTIVGTNNTIYGIENTVIGSNINASGENNVLSGNSIIATGLNSILHGSDLQSSGINNLVFGTNIVSSGNSSISVGSNLVSEGNDNFLLGNNNQISGSGNVIVSSNTSVSGELSNTTIYGAKNTLDESDFYYANLFGQNNSLSSGTLHNLLVGTNNTIQNRYNFTLPSVSFNVSDNGTKFVGVDFATQINNYRVSDTILYYGNDGTLLGSGVIQSVYIPNDSDTDLIIQPVAALSTNNNSVIILSQTKQQEVINNYSRPVSVIGNENDIIGFSGVVVGHNNSISGYNNTIIGSDNIYGGDNSIVISQRFAGSGFNNIVNIGFDNVGGLSGANTLGQNNIGIGFQNNIFGINNVSAGDTDVFGNDNQLMNGDSSVVGRGNTVLGKGQRELGDISDIYDTKNRLDFTGYSSNPTGSGYYSLAYQCLLLDNDVTWQFSSGNQASVQLYYNDIPLSTYIGRITNDPKIVNGFKAVFFDNTVTINQQEVLVNPVSINQFIENYFPTQTPETLQFTIQHKIDGSTVIAGSGNLVIGSPYSVVMGNSNQMGIDWKNPKDVVAVSGLLVGHNNQTYHPLRFIKNANGTVVGIEPLYPDASGLFQGAIGFDIRNADPNSIKIGYDQNIIKIFDLGGKKDASSSIVVDPNVTPPETVTTVGEKIGTGVYLRGLIFNADTIDNSLHVLNNSTEKEPVLSIISNGSGYIGINKSYPSYHLDVAGIIKSTDSVITSGVYASNLQMSSGAAPGYFLSSYDSEGNAEWVAGVRVDVSGYPGTLVYYSGTPATGGKVQPISLSTIVQNKEWQVNTYTYEPSGCNVSRSGLIFDQYMNVDKYAIMTLDEHRRSVMGYPLEEVQRLPQVNPGKIDYIQRLIDLAKEKKISDDSHFIPRQYNALYFIPESTAYSTPSADLALASSSSNLRLNLEKAGQAQQSLFVIGRRKAELSQPVQLDRGEDVDVDNKLFPGGVSAPQIVLSTIPKKDLAGQNSYLRPKYKYNYDELVSPYMAPYDEELVGAQYDVIRPMSGGTAAPVPGVSISRTYQSWWYYDPSDTTGGQGSKPIDFRYSTIQRTVPTAFNLNREEVDFVIYGTGSKYPQDKVSKFLFGDVSQYVSWKKTGLGREDSNFPFLTTVPAFYFNASNGSFMIHTDRPAWIPTKIAADCEPCDPIQSGINFADLTVRGWIGASGIRIGQGFRRAYTTNNEGKLVEAIDSQGKPIYETTSGMVLMSDAYGFATWTPLGGTVTTNDTLSSQSTSDSTVVLTEGVLDPISSVGNLGLEGLESDSARLYRDTVNVSNETTIANPVLRLRGVTRNSLLFAKNPLPNRTDNFSNDFNESSLPTNPNEMNIDGTENLFYYGYTNALAGIVDVNPESGTTEVVIDGDATRRFNINDIVRIYYKYDTTVQNQIVRTSTIERARVIGLYTVALTEPINGRYSRTSVVLDKLLTNVSEASYLLDSSNELRNVAIISQSIGGYLTFNFPGTNPDIVISNREFIDTTFNANGKFTNFAINGAKSGTAVPTLLYADTTTNSIQINSNKPFIYGYETRSINNIGPSLEKNINSSLYYNYNVNGQYLDGSYDEEDNTLTVAEDNIDVVTGDVIEIIYDNNQDIKASVQTIDDKVITISFKAINLGMIEDKIGNIIRSTGGVISNGNFKFRVIKRQLAKKVDVVGGGVVVTAEDKVPLYADFSIRGLTYTDGLMLGEKDQNNNVIIKNQSLLYSDNGLVSGSNLGYVDVVALNNNNSVTKHLVFNNDMPRPLSLVKYRDKPELPISASNPEKLQPIFANFSMYGTVYAQQMHVDTLNRFNSIDGGVVQFRGSCNSNTNVCVEPQPTPGQ
jgi:hypothetical protein